VIIVEINIDKLREDLIDYFGTALYNASPLAIIELSKVETASPQELINIALKNNFDLSEYQTNNKSLL
jgi:hypothetical protein